MKRTPAQAGPFAAWLKRKREERYPRQVDALEDMRRLAGIAISASEFAQWESGSRIPREDNPKRLRLIEFFGGWTDEPDMAGAGVGDDPSLVPALLRAVEAQTLAIGKLIEKLDSLASQAIRDGIADALREAGLGPDGGASPDEPPPGPQP